MQGVLENRVEALSSQLLSIDSAVDVQLLEADYELRTIAANVVGSVVAGTMLEIEAIKDSEEAMSLDKAIQLANEGDMQARAMVYMNVRTDYFERAYKSGHVTSVRLGRNEQGQLVQHGQKILDTHKNSIVHLSDPVIRDRAKAEMTNGIRGQFYADNGLLRDNVLVTFSLVTRRKTETDAKKLGFFTDTMSASFQLMSEDDEGVYIETAFVAGRERQGETSLDVESARAIAKILGVNLDSFDADEIIEHPILIPKTVISSVTDLARLHDSFMSQNVGIDTFFGRVMNDEKPQYDTYLEQCRIREESMEEKIQQAVRLLLDSANMINSPVDATSLLDRINDRVLKEQIIYDDSIDPTVLGTEAAYYVNHARYLYSQDVNHHNLQILQREINKKGQSSSCPGAAKNDKDISTMPWDTLDAENGENNETSLEDCDFISKECPKCKKKNVKTECRAGVYYGACGCSSK